MYAPSAAPLAYHHDEAKLQEFKTVKRRMHIATGLTAALILFGIVALAGVTTGKFLPYPLFAAVLLTHPFLAAYYLTMPLLAVALVTNLLSAGYFFYEFIIVIRVTLPREAGSLYSYFVLNAVLLGIIFLTYLLNAIFHIHAMAKRFSAPISVAYGPQHPLVENQYAQAPHTGAPMPPASHPAQEPAVYV